MASVGIKVTDVVSDLGTISSLGLVAGVNYTLQNKAEYRLRISQAEEAPDPHSDVGGATLSEISALVLNPYDSVIFKMPEDDSIYVWYPEGQSGIIAIVEAP